MLKKNLVSIIIINWNGRHYLKNCLQSVFRNDYPTYEVIVVDNGSTDASIDYIASTYPLVRLLKNKINLGFAEANNQGINTSRGEFVLFLNNDTKVTKNFLTILVNKLKSDPKMGACQPKILHWEKKGKLDSVGSFLTNTGFLYHLGFEAEDSKKYDKEIKLFSGKGSCLLFKRKILDEIGYFDKDFFAYFEETDLCWRLWLAGYYLMYIPSATTYHKTWGTTRRLSLSFITYHSFKNRIASLIMNLELKNVIFIMPKHIIFCFLIIIYYLLKGNSSNSFAIIKAFKWSILNFKKIWIKRNFVQQKIRKVPDFELFKTIMKNAGFSYYLYILKYSFVRSKVFQNEK